MGSPLRPAAWLSLVLLVGRAANCAETAADPPLAAGIAWRVVGDWGQLPGAGRLVRTGAPIRPGALLRPAENAGVHSITLLLPDGQRILYECFTEEDCARGFRVPALTDRPTPFAVEMLARMGRALLAEARPETGQPPPAPARTTPPHREEAVAALGPVSRVSVPLPMLPEGSYHYDLGPFPISSFKPSSPNPSSANAAPAQYGLPLTKMSSDCGFAVPGAGLYRIVIWDERNTPRIDLVLAAIKPEQTEAFARVARAKKLMAGWDALYYGWPIHDLLRAYLESLEADQDSVQRRQISSP